MSRNLAILVFLCFTIHLNAQVDRAPKSVPIPAEETKDDKEETAPVPILITPEIKPSLSDKKDHISGIPFKNRVTMKPSEKEFSMMDQSGLIDPGTIYDKRWADEKRKQQLEIYDDIPPELLGDQFLGDFRITGNYVTVICRDFGEEDGDLIQVLLNDKVIVSRLQLTHGRKSFQIPLAEGINKIDFLALNQGALGFNTAFFQLFDDTDTAISKNKWFLATSKKATLVLIKE